MHPFFEGLFFGLLLSIMIGPIFFTLIQTSLQQGFERGLSVAFGASTSDMLILLACFFGYVKVSMNQMNGKLLGLTGVAILMITGILMIRKTNKQAHCNDASGNKKSILSNFIKGFLINSMNPFVFIFWLGVVGFTAAKYNNDITLISSFILGAIVITFATDMIKIYLSGKLKALMNTQLIHRTSVFIGAIIILYSLRLFWQIF